MTPRQQTVNLDLVNRVREKIYKEYIRLIERPVDEPDITITVALTDDEIERLILMALKEAKQPLSWREIKRIFVGIAGEDRLRRILNKLKANNIIAELTRTRYALPEYVPANEIHKVKNPGILAKIMKMKQNITQ
ncbi:MAG: hypothetical protein LRS48_06270 [Desulfurococcales archaeon]|nr:hypothetical protein [Desulfurococcales archaeon]